MAELTVLREPPSRKRKASTSIEFSARPSQDMASASCSSLSSPTSFVTAHDATADKSTAASSPVQDKSCPYRETRQLPRELKEHCQIFLEEQLCRCRASHAWKGVLLTPGQIYAPSIYSIALRVRAHRSYHQVINPSRSLLQATSPYCLRSLSTRCTQPGQRNKSI